MHLKRKPPPYLSNSSKIGVHRSTISPGTLDLPFPPSSEGRNSNRPRLARPIKPVTTSTPTCFWLPAVHDFMVLTAQLRISSRLSRKLCRSEGYPGADPTLSPTQPNDMRCQRSRFEPISIHRRFQRMCNIPYPSPRVRIDMSST